MMNILVKKNNWGQDSHLNLIERIYKRSEAQVSIMWSQIQIHESFSIHRLFKVKK